MSAPDTASSRSGASIAGLLSALELELRTAGQLAFATCESLREDRSLRGLEGCLAFLRCTTFAVDLDVPAIARRTRVQACRLLLLSVAAHTEAPRWTWFRLEHLFETAMQIPGAELSDVVHALFALLAETTGPTTTSQTCFIREVADHVAERRDRGQSVADFVWIAVRLSDPLLAVTESQAYLAALALPQTLRDQARRVILESVHSRPLVDELIQLLPR